MTTLFEILQFLKSRKKLWMAPIIVVMIVLGGLLILVQGSVVAPFVYTLFDGGLNVHTGYISLFP